MTLFACSPKAFFASVKPPRRPLIEGTKLRCPRCKQLSDILEFQPMMQIEEYENETVPILKCPISRCRWLFALKPDLLPSEIDALVEKANAGAGSKQKVAA